MSQIEIKDLQPFNELFYKTCFYNSLFAVMKYYKRQLLDIFAYDMWYYFLNKAGVIDSKVIESAHVISLIDKMGITIHSPEDDIIKFIISELDKMHPTIINIDCYDLPYRRDTFKQIHLCHSLLIKGVDLDTRCFKVIDQLNYESLTYGEHFISFEDILIAHASFLKRYHTGEYYSVSSYANNSIAENRSVAYYKDVMIRVFKQNQQVYMDGLLQLKYFSENIKNYLEETQDIYEKLESLIPGINNIVNAKLSRKYKLSLMQLTYKEERMTLEEEIAKGWAKLRSIMLRMIYSKRINHSKLDEVILLVKKIYEKELYLKNINCNEVY